jgi:protein gp37
MPKTKISWTDEAWNYLSWNCNKVSPGCKHCYAQTHSEKYPRNSAGGEFLGAPRVRDNALKELAVIKPGNTVFVNTHSDTFHEKLPIGVTYDLFKHMNQRPDLIFLLLTKRPQMAELIGHELKWTDNIWLGTSVESADYLHRINALDHIPAAHKFISFEPLLGHIPQAALRPALRNIEWVITGGESGQNYRPFGKQWAVDIQKTCSEMRIPFYFKQGSGLWPDSDRLLNGQIYDERPEVFSRLQEKYAVKEVQQSLF